MENTNTEKVFCHECGCECKPDGIFAGYGTDKDGNKFCYECCGKHDEKLLDELKEGERTSILYLHREKDTNGSTRYFATNWPATLKIRIYFTREGRHNIAGTRTDAWFYYKNKHFHGVQYGNFNDILHVQRLRNCD